MRKTVDLSVSLRIQKTDGSDKYNMFGRSDTITYLYSSCTYQSTTSLEGWRWQHAKMCIIIMDWGWQCRPFLRHERRFACCKAKTPRKRSARMQRFQLKKRQLFARINCFGIGIFMTVGFYNMLQHIVNWFCYKKNWLAENTKIVIDARKNIKFIKVVFFL